VEIIDAQIHIWDKHSPERPWLDFARRRDRPGAPGARHLPEVTIDQMLMAMTAVGVDAGVIFTPALYGPDNSYSLLAAAQHPDRYAVAGNINPTDPNVEEMIRNWRSQPGALAVRMPLFRPEGREAWREGKFETALAAAQRYRVPLATYAPGLLRELVPTVEKYPDLQFVLDHFGLPQPTPHSDTDPDPFQRLPDLLNLAQYPNVAVKISAAMTLSKEKFPYKDLWPPIHKIISAFRLDRVMWGSDWTRVLHVNTYAQDVIWITETSELSASDKEKLLGRWLRGVMGWPKLVSSARGEDAIDARAGAGA
jgi:L-fuconolactonase